MKTGLATTEFWVTVATNIGLVTASATSVLPPKWAAICSAISVVAYNVSRGLAKHGTPGA